MPSTDDIEDAEFEVLHLSTVIPSNADRLGPRMRKSDARPRAGMDMLKSASVNGAGAARERAGPLFWAMGVVVALASFWVSGGHTLSGPLIARLSPAAIAALGVIASRANAIVALARAIEAGALRLDPSAPVDDTLAALERIPGVGPWTAQYVAMRALAWPDAFPHPDVAVLKALKEPNGKKAHARAEAWRPWRSYAVLHLWKSLE